MVDIRRMRTATLRSLLAFAFVASGACAQDAASPKRTVWVVADKDTPRTVAVMETLRSNGLHVRLLERGKCAPEALRTAHVVVVDWPANDPLGDRLPLGPYERWDRPTVFLGSAGTRFAGHWGLPTAATMAAMDAGALGPEMHELRPTTPARSVVWRQGNVFHFGADDTIDPCAEDERAWLAQTVRDAILFANDRAILVHGFPAGQEPSAQEQERRRRVRDGAAEFGIAVDDPVALLAVPNRMRGANDADSEAWLRAATFDAQPAGSTNQVWMQWLQPRFGALVWDPLSSGWRLDALAHRRGAKSAELRGWARAEANSTDAAATALAAKVVQHHGGAAFADLTTFSCWMGDQFCQWDRRAGVFRVENFVEIPAGNLATPWQLAVLDTLADADLIRGGGPAPRPFVSARATFRDCVEQVFLLALLLEPGVTVRRVPEADSDGKQALGVKLGMRGMDPAAEHVLFVDPATGAVDYHRRMVRGRQQRGVRFEAFAACGPLRLPAEFLVELGRNRRATTIADAKWNPELPATLATATERLAQPRDK